MKRTLWIVLFICFFISACSGQTSDSGLQRALDFRTALMASAGCAYEARVLADYGERVYDFNLQCEYIPDREAKLTVISPDIISGISAVISSDGTNVEFDGASLDFGEMANGNVAPMTVPFLLGRAWSSEYIHSVGQDGDYILVSYLMGYGDREIVVETWLADDGTPVRCDISHAGTRCITVSISDFKLN